MSVPWSQHVTEVAKLYTTMNKTEKNWYAVYTKPRWEKKVHQRLTAKGLQSWCPVQKVQRQWSDRKKMIEDPVFKSYVFVCITDEERLPVLETDGVLNFVHFLGKPAMIRKEEINTIKSYLMENDATLTVESLRLFREQDKVVIKQGVFMDNTGTILKTGSKKVYVKLESLDQVLIVEFPVSHVAHHAMP